MTKTFQHVSEGDQLNEVRYDDPAVEAQPPSCQDPGQPE
jgi:hypothetical protein